MIGLNLTSCALCLLVGFTTEIGWSVGRWLVGKVLK